MSDAAAGTVDPEATAELRQAMWRQQLRQGVPDDEFMANWLQRPPPAAALQYHGPWPGGCPE